MVCAELLDLSMPIPKPVVDVNGPVEAFEGIVLVLIVVNDPGPTGPV